MPLYETLDGKRYRAFAPLSPDDHQITDQRDEPANVDKHTETNSVFIAPETQFRLTLHQLVGLLVAVVAIAGTVYLFSSRLDKLEESMNANAEFHKNAGEQIKGIMIQMQDLEDILLRQQRQHDHTAATAQQKGTRP